MNRAGGSRWARRPLLLSGMIEKTMRDLDHPNAPAFGEQGRTPPTERRGIASPFACAPTEHGAPASTEAAAATASRSPELRAGNRHQIRPVVPLARLGDAPPRNRSGICTPGYSLRFVMRRQAQRSTQTESSGFTPWVNTKSRIGAIRR